MSELQPMQATGGIKTIIEVPRDQFVTPRKKTMIFGIDPGVNTGFAVKFRNEDKFRELLKLTFWEAIERLKLYKLQCDALNDDMLVYIENPNLNPPTFDRGEGQNRKRNRISQNVGMNKRDAQLIIDWLKKNNIPYYEIRPSKRSGVNVDHYKFKKLTGWQGKTNQHMRDAGMLIVGR